MSDLLVARRYANALHDLAKDASALDAVDADMTLVDETIDGAKDLSLMLASPIVSRDKKKNVVKAIFGSQIGKQTLDFLLLLVDKGREQTLPEIAAAYRELRDTQQGVMQATARTAEPMTADEQGRLQEALEKSTGKWIRLDVQQDPSVMGGVVVRVGDMVYDRSVSNGLAQLREQFGLEKARTS